MTTTRNRLHEQGRAMRDRLFGADGDGAPDLLGTVNIEATYGAIWSRPGLALEDRMVCALAALAAAQRLRKLRRHVGAARLDVAVAEHQQPHVGRRGGEAMSPEQFWNPFTLVSFS